MNEVEFRAEQFKALHPAHAGTVSPNAVITGIRLEDGSYYVLSRFGDDVWTLPSSLFYAGVGDYHKTLNFKRVPVAFRETLRICMVNYILSGIEGRKLPRGSTIYEFFVKATSFLIWLHGQRIAHLSDVTPLISSQYVEFCKGLKGRKGEPLSGTGQRMRFSAVETLHILSNKTDDPMRHPWPESSASHLAGITGQGNPYLHEVKTKIIPDDILGPLFQSAVDWLDRADEIVNLRDQVETWKSEGRNRDFIRLNLEKKVGR